MSLRKKIKSISIIKEIYYRYKAAKRLRRGKIFGFFINQKYFRVNGDFYKQVFNIITNCNICPIENNSFFYSIDTNIVTENNDFKMNNYTVDYDLVVNYSFKDVVSKLDLNNECDKKILIIIDALKNYVISLEKSQYCNLYIKQIDAIKTLFDRRANNLFEALQRILFINQFLWQNGHILNGLGRLDFILDRVYSESNISKKETIRLLTDFFYALHSYYRFKSNDLIGDTGQIIVLGGKTEENQFFINDLTHYFVEVASLCKLPDPKILLRVSKLMPDSMYDEIISCISTGIGQPLLANDDFIVDKLVEFGYNKTNCYNYVTSACWEPLVINDGIELNNLVSLNFIKPLLDSIEEKNSDNEEYIYNRYLKKLRNSIIKIFDQVEDLKYDQAPLFSLFSLKSLEKHRDIMQNKDVTHNVGILSVGLSNLVNSLLTIKNSKSRFGDDNEEVINLTNGIVKYVDDILTKYNLSHKIKIKLGLSSPSYLTEGNETKASPDARKNYEPFSTNISADGIAPTSLLNFASKIDYGKNCFNGDVVDIIFNKNIVDNHKEKIAILIKTAILMKVPEMQFNVFDSKILIEAKNFPNKYPNLVVRVWGFSAYFNDLPIEYKNLLIKRAIKSENRDAQ